MVIPVILNKGTKSNFFKNKHAQTIPCQYTPVNDSSILSIINSENCKSAVKLLLSSAHLEFPPPNALPTSAKITINFKISMTLKELYLTAKLKLKRLGMDVSSIYMPKSPYLQISQTFMTHVSDLFCKYESFELFSFGTFDL